MQANEFCAFLFTEKPTTDNILKCLLGLNDTDTEILKLLKKPKTTNQLVEKIGKNQSTVQRSLTKLMAIGVVIRERKTKGRGYYYEFKRLEKDALRKRLIEEIDRKTKVIKQIINQM
ncbi:MAG: ArsR family transcriptional regulator [Candidatus Diapherotrites archaeon]|nr:ArsR family transcriptional regulator [Candidatus Diapherotrites archaeon]